MLRRLVCWLNSTKRKRNPDRRTASVSELLRYVRTEVSTTCDSGWVGREASSPSEQHLANAFSVEMPCFVRIQGCRELQPWAGIGQRLRRLEAGKLAVKPNVTHPLSQVVLTRCHISALIDVAMRALVNGLTRGGRHGRVWVGRR